MKNSAYQTPATSALDENTITEEIAPLDAAVLKPILDRVRTDDFYRVVNGKPKPARRKIKKTDILNHINGGVRCGGLPLAPGESTTRIAVLDLDSHKGESSWADMQAAAFEISSTLGLYDDQPAPFRSSGGKGIHLYLLWDKPQDAHSVRENLKGLLSICGFTEGTAGIANKQVEIFPKQAEVAEGRYGNMFVLPLAGKSAPLDPETMEVLPREQAAHIQWPSCCNVPKLERAKPSATQTLSNEDPDMATSALWAIPNDGSVTELDDRGEWFKLICAFKEGAGESGREDAREWTAQHPNDEPELFDAVWDSIKIGNENGAPADYLFTLAQRYGFIDHLLADFDDISGGVEDVATITTYEYSPFELKPVEYVVDGYIGTGLTTIAGAPGVGKTSLLVPLAAAVAHCYTSPLNPELQRKVIYLAEDTDQVSRCLYGVSKAACVVSKGEFTSRFKILQSKRLKPAALGKLISKLVKENTVHHNGYAVGPLIVIDTSNANLDLESENDNAEVGKAIAAIKENLGNAACWLVTHTPKALKSAPEAGLSARGSSAFEGDSNQTAYIFDNGVTSKRFMKGGKVRFEPEFSELEFTTSVISETVKTSWGGEQTIKIRYGIPDKSSTAARLVQKELEDAELKEQTVEAKKEAILIAVSETPKSATKIADSVSGRRTTTFEIIKKMANTGELTVVSSKNSADIYGKGNPHYFADSTGGADEGGLC